MTVLSRCVILAPFVAAVLMGCARKGPEAAGAQQVQATAANETENPPNSEVATMLELALKESAVPESRKEIDETIAAIPHGSLREKRLVLVGLLEADPKAAWQQQLDVADVILTSLQPKEVGIRVGAIAGTVDYFYRRTAPKEAGDIAVHAYREFTDRRKADIPTQCIAVLRDARVPANDAITFVVRGINSGKTTDAIMADAQAFATKQRQNPRRT